MSARVLVLVLVAACGSYSTYKSTRIVAPGHSQWLAGLQVSGAATAGVDAENNSYSAGLPLPELALGWRRGLDENHELQINGTLLPLKQGQTGSLEVAGKARLWRSGRWSLASQAALGYRIADIGGGIVEAGYGSLPVIGGVDVGRHQIVLSLVPGYERLYATGANPVGLPFIGESVGFLWQVSKNWAVLPEAGSYWSPTSNFMTTHTQLFHVGIAVAVTR